MTIEQRCAITPLPHRSISVKVASFISKNSFLGFTIPAFCDSLKLPVLGKTESLLPFHFDHFQGFSMFLVTNAVCEAHHTRQARQSTIAQMLDKAARAILLIAFASVVAACSGVPLIPGI